MIGGETETVQRVWIRFSRRWRPGAGTSHARPGREEAARPARGRLSPLRAVRRGPFREDGPQRHRVRLDAGLCRGLRHHAQRQLEGACRKTSLRFQPRRHRRSLAPRQRGRLLAAGSDGDGAAPKIPSCRASPANVQDSGEGRWTIMAAIEEAVPCRCSPRRSTRVSARGRTIPSPRKSCPRCANNLAATSRQPVRGSDRCIEPARNEADAGTRLRSGRSRPARIPASWSSSAPPATSPSAS